MITLFIGLWALVPMFPPGPSPHRPPASAPDSIAARLNRELNPYLETRAADDGFSGVVVVAHDGQPVFARAFGEATRLTHRANTLDTRFNLASATKMFTAVAIAQLLEQGRVSLDTPFGHYLPNYANRSVADRVTIRQLLSHTSGMGSYFNQAFLEHRGQVRKVSDLVRFFVNDSLQFEPGSRFGYSNAGFVVLGLVIERVSGESYYDYVRRHVFEPAGMAQTGFPLVTALRAGDAVGYTHPPGPDGQPQRGPRTANSEFVELKGSPAGGAYSTAHDLIAFSRALWAGRLVNRDWVSVFTHGTTPMGSTMPTLKYALGFGELTLGGARIVGHNGGAPGVNAEFDMYPASDYDVVVLSNYDPPSATAVIVKIREIMTGVALPVRPLGPHG